MYLRYAFYRERSDGSGTALLNGPERNLLWLSLPSAYPLWPRWDRPYVDIEHPQKGRGGNLSPLSGGERLYLAGVAAIMNGPESDLFWFNLPWVYLDIEHPQKSLGDNLSPLSGGE